MNFDEALRRAQLSGRFVRREAWSMSRASIIYDLDVLGWFDAFGRPYTPDHSDTAAMRDAQDWIIVGDPT
jgi:hypothetical protein